MPAMELFRTCANEHVAEAAMASIGGALERRVIRAARGAGVPTGVFIVRLVREFDCKASPKRRKWLESAMDRQDMPLLAGLRRVIETALSDAWDVIAPTGPDGDCPPRGWTPPRMRVDYRAQEFKNLPL